MSVGVGVCNLVTGQDRLASYEATTLKNDL